jgi:hypothetical protein
MAIIDDESDASVSDDGPVIFPDRDDEDALTNITLYQNVTASVRVSARNQRGIDAYLYGWLDINRDGNFDNATERASVLVPSGLGDHNYVLTFRNIPLTTAVGPMQSRFRLSTDPSSESPVGYAFDGEVEDHIINVRSITEGIVQGKIKL